MRYFFRVSQYIFKFKWIDEDQFMAKDTLSNLSCGSITSKLVRDKNRL